MSQLSIPQKSVFKKSDAKEQRTQPYYTYKTSPQKIQRHNMFVFMDFLIWHYAQLLC